MAEKQLPEHWMYGRRSWLSFTGCQYSLPYTLHRLTGMPLMVKAILDHDAPKLEGLLKKTCGGDNTNDGACYSPPADGNEEVEEEAAQCADTTPPQRKRRVLTKKSSASVDDTVIHYPTNALYNGWPASTATFRPLALAAAITHTSALREDGYGSENDYEQEDSVGQKTIQITNVMKTLLAYGANVTIHPRADDPLNGILAIVANYPAGRFPAARKMCCECQFAASLVDLHKQQMDPNAADGGLGDPPTADVVVPSYDFLDSEEYNWYDEEEEAALSSTTDNTTANVDDTPEFLRFRELACARCKLNYARIAVLCDNGADVEGSNFYDSSAIGDDDSNPYAAYGVQPPTPLHYAASSRFIGTVYALLIHGANPNAVTLHTKAPLGTPGIPERDAAAAATAQRATPYDMVYTPPGVYSEGTMQVEALLRCFGGKPYKELPQA